MSAEVDGNDDLVDEDIVLADLQEMAEREACRIEADFSDENLLSLIHNHGSGSV